MLEKTILFDLCHNEMLNIEEEEFTNFKNLLKNLNLKVKINKSENLTKPDIQNIDIIVIGNPIDDYFSVQEIRLICDFVRTGGALILISEYGADFLQKTNLNDLSGKNFGIFFERNLIKELINGKESSIIHIKDFDQIEITNNLREIVMGGTCSIFLNNESRALIRTNEKNTWSEVFNSSKEEWVKEKEQKQVLAAFTEYGKGKVLAFGDIDIFTNDTKIGINAFDNQQFLQNVIDWLLLEVKEPNVMKFTLSQVGDLQSEVREINNAINNIIETMTILETRISYLEQKLNVSLSKQNGTDVSSEIQEED
jgi:hypothetical protein